MRPSRERLVIAVIAVATFVAAAAHAADIMRTKAVGNYKIELHVLPAEPFFTKPDVIDKHIKSGMEIEGGAAPVAADAASHPNHHLVVHIFGTQGGGVITDAAVAMSFVPIDGHDKASGATVAVPVVTMQAIGGGPKSTH